MIQKISFQRFLLIGCRMYCFDALERVKWFGFKNKTSSSSRISPIRSRGAITVILVHSNMGSELVLTDIKTG
jgi:hypothetical protein